VGKKEKAGDDSLLDKHKMKAVLAALPDWTLQQGALFRSFRFHTYLAGIEFVQQVARLAESQNHHPDLFVAWRKVDVSIISHDLGGITHRDVSLAEAIEKSLNSETR